MAKGAARKNRMKLLVGIINREDELKFCEALNDVSASLHFSGLGHGTAPSSHKSFFGFNEIDKRVTMSLIPAELEHSMLSAVGHGVIIPFLFTYKTLSFNKLSVIEKNVVSCPAHCVKSSVGL